MSFLIPLAALWLAGTLLLRGSRSGGGPGLAGWRREAAESFGLGTAVSYLVFLLGVWLGPADLSWLAVAPLFGAVLFLLRRSRAPDARHAQARPEPWTIGEVALAAAVALALCGGAALLFATPLLDWDTRILWALKAKILAAERTPVSETFRDPYRLHIHPRYPLLVPWLASLPSQVAAGFRETQFQAVAALLAVLGVLQLYRLGRDGGSRGWALFGALVMVVTAGWLRGLFAAGVELALLFFVLLAVQALWRWLQRGRGADIALAAVYLFGAASVKNEGLVLGLCLAAALAVVLLRDGSGHRRLAALPALLGFWALLLSVWWWHLRFIPPVSDENYLARLRPALLGEGLARLPVLAREVLAHALDLGTWHLVWVALPLLCLAALRRGARADARAFLLAVTILLYGAAIVVVYLLSPWRDLAQHIGVTFDRIVLPLLPLVILLLVREMAARSRRA